MRNSNRILTVACAPLLGMALSGCEARLNVQSATAEDAAKIAGDIAYMKDARTELCFAVLKSQTHGPLYVASITHVPCDKAGL